MRFCLNKGVCELYDFFFYYFSDSLPGWNYFEGREHIKSKNSFRVVSPIEKFVNKLFMVAAEITEDVGILLGIFEISYIYFLEVDCVTRMIF